MLAIDMPVSSCVKFTIEKRGVNTGYPDKSSTRVIMTYIEAHFPFPRQFHEHSYTPSTLSILNCTQLWPSVPSEPKRPQPSTKNS